MKLPTLSLTLLTVAFGQAAQSRLAFEAASVRVSNRPNAFPRGGGGPGSRFDDPERLHLENIPMQNLLMAAYELEEYQIAGPGWLGSEKYDIDAKIAPGVTKEQFDVMFQNLLVERFGLTVHHESRQFAGYELVIAKGKSKLRETPPDTPAWNLADGPPKAGKDKDGLPELPPGHILLGTFSTPVGTRISARGQPLSALLRTLGPILKGPVNDQTGLTGKYDFSLTFLAPKAPVPPDSQGEPAPNVFVAFEDQLGLKLIAKRSPSM